MSTDAGYEPITSAPKLTAITVTLSSHPDFRYFVDVRAVGRQVLARRFDALDEVDAFVTKCTAAAVNAGFTVETTDRIPADYTEEN